MSTTRTPSVYIPGADVLGIQREMRRQAQMIERQHQLDRFNQGVHAHTQAIADVLEGIRNLAYND